MNPVHILLVEDNPADVDLMREALEQKKVQLKVTVATDGMQAVEILRGDGSGNGARPDLIILDLNLPKKDGREVLAEIKRDPQTRSIPVVVLTSSAAETDILKSYDLGANCFVRKPLDFVQLQEIVSQVEAFWFTIVRLPPRSNDVS